MPVITTSERIKRAKELYAFNPLKGMEIAMEIDGDLAYWFADKAEKKYGKAAVVHRAASLGMPVDWLASDAGNHWGDN